MLSQPVTAEGAVRSAEKLEGPTTPTGKVIHLLKDLSAKITSAGKDEATSYDKFACFCKEQADGKLYAIEKSNKTIEGQNARIEELSAEIDEFATAISELEGKISEKETETSALEEERAKEHAAYVNRSAEAEGAIDAVGRAIVALKGSKASLPGKTELLAMMALAQVREVVLRSRLVSLTAAQARALGSQPGAPHSYSYHSDEIIQTLEGLLDTFKKEKAVLDTEELEAKAAFEKVRLGLQNEAKFAGMEKAEKEKLEAKAQEEKHATEEAMAEETTAKNADNAFLDVLTAECEEKAQFWDQRSQTRAAELTAISEAIEALETGVVPNAGANKKLTGLQVRQTVKKSAASFRAPSFLQLRGSGSGSPAGVPRAELLRLLDAASSRLGSSALALAALQVRAATDPTDHFVKVRGIINDLIAKLEAEALAEETQKGFCDEQIKKAVTARDEAISNEEAFSKDLDSKQAQVNELEKKIADLSQEIADNKKALLEATELRGEERTENEKVIADATAGKEAVAQAIKVLTEFYDSAAGVAFLQRRAGFVPAGSDRTGATVSDLAPEVFGGEYQGEQDSAKGIIGLLQVIHDDFDRTITATGDEETGAESDFEEFKSENEGDTLAKNTEVEAKDSEITSLKEELVQLQEDIADVKKEHQAQLDELARLKEMCVEGAESYEERVEKRQQEIEALKEAHAILENWKGL